MSRGQLPGLKSYHPTTFEERGVAVPFTTPMLSGTRARPTEKQGVELLIPNPSGGRGVYIMPWSAISTWCRPTLHDTVFNERVANLLNVTPASIRRVGLELAAEGLAGEEAMQAALTATNAEKEERLITNYHLLMALVQQVGVRFPASPSASNPNKIDLSMQARLTVDWVSPRLGQPAAWTASALEALSDVMGNIGVAPATASSRLPRLLATLHQVRTDMAGWGEIQQEGELVECVKIVCAVADLTLSLGASTLAKGQDLTSDMINLLQTWATDPKSVVQLVMRPEWLLDGWEQICLIWDHAQDHADRRAAMVEILGLVPVLPQEAGQWSDTGSDATKELRYTRSVALNEDWRTGSLVFRLIDRNEHLRAIAYSNH